MITPLPLPKALYEKAKALGVSRIELHWSGGYDEGYFSSSVLDSEGKAIWDLDDDIDNWVSETYKYSGAGCGQEYGDSLIYDLVKNKVVKETWEMVRSDESYTADCDISEP